MKQRFKMLDYEISVDYGPHVINRLFARFYDLDTEYLDYILSTIFSNQTVSDFLINDVKIGEDVVVIDEESGLSMAVNIGTELFFVKTIYNAYEGNLLIAERQEVLRVGKSGELKVEKFRLKEKVGKEA